MSIERRKGKTGSVTYRARVYINKKLVKAASFKRAIDAQKWENEQKYLIEQGKHFPTTPKEIRLNELYENWLENHARIKKTAGSVKKDEQCYRDYINPHIGDLKAQEVSPNDIDRIIVHLKNKTKLSNNSINKVLQIARALFNYGIKKRFLVYNPVIAVDFLPVELSSFDFWPRETVSRFLEYTDSKYETDRSPYLIYLTALSTGMRAGEIFALKWDCIDFTKKLIIVRRTVDNAVREIRETTKGKKIRYVGINDKLFNELIKLKSKSKSEFVFSCPVTHERLDYSNFRNRHFLKDIKQSGVRYIRFHDLRHTFASHYMMNNGNIFDLKQILGHSDIKTTQVYAHLAPDHIAHTASIVDFSPKTKIEKSPNVISGRF
ncbi:MAG: site-specific integrase [Oligoflexia bacterium]|nr:site-specific integrase [Oligoflexia bacterium]